jgi:hypothetical protein
LLASYFIIYHNFKWAWKHHDADCKGNGQTHRGRSTSTNCGSKGFNKRFQQNFEMMLMRMMAAVWKTDRLRLQCRIKCVAYSIVYWLVVPVVRSSWLIGSGSKLVGMLAGRLRLLFSTFNFNSASLVCLLFKHRNTLTEGHTETQHKRTSFVWIWRWEEMLQIRIVLFVLVVYNQIRRGNEQAGKCVCSVILGQ